MNAVRVLCVSVFAVTLLAGSVTLTACGTEPKEVCASDADCFTDSKYACDAQTKHCLRTCETNRDCIGGEANPEDQQQECDLDTNDVGVCRPKEG